MNKFSREQIILIATELHFLPIKAQLHFKICLLVYKAFKFRQPAYLLELLHYRELTRPLRSDQHNKQLVEPIIAQSNFSNRCVSYSAPRIYIINFLIILNPPKLSSLT